MSATDPVKFNFRSSWFGLKPVEGSKIPAALGISTSILVLEVASSLTCNMSMGIPWMFSDSHCAEEIMPVDS